MGSLRRPARDVAAPRQDLAGRRRTFRQKGLPGRPDLPEGPVQQVLRSARENPTLDTGGIQGESATVGVVLAPSRVWAIPCHHGVEPSLRRSGPTRAHSSRAQAPTMPAGDGFLHVDPVGSDVVTGAGAGAGAHGAGATPCIPGNANDESGGIITEALLRKLHRLRNGRAPTDGNLPGDPGHADGIEVARHRDGCSLTVEDGLATEVGEAPVEGCVPEGEDTAIGGCPIESSMA